MRIIKQSPYCFNELEINRDWLPAYIANNTPLLAELNCALIDHFRPYEGKYFYDELGTQFNSTTINRGLDKMHEFAVNWLCKRVLVPGLKEYLNAISYLRAPKKGKLDIVTGSSKKENNQ